SITPGITTSSTISPKRRRHRRAEQQAERSGAMRQNDRSDPGQGSAPPRYPGSFLLAFRQALATLNWNITRWLPSAVECTDAEGRHQYVGLENLYRRARQEDRATWPEMIRDFLSQVRVQEIEATPRELALVADRLMPRIGRPIGSRSEAAEVWSQPLNDS